MFNADILYFGGCWVLQTGNINLAFTDSIGTAMEAGKQLGFDGEPYWTQYTVTFANAVERDLFLQKINTTCGKAYLSSFIVSYTDKELVLAGYCVL